MGVNSCEAHDKIAIEDGDRHRKEANGEERLTEGDDHATVQDELSQHRRALVAYAAVPDDQIL